MIKIIRIAIFEMQGYAKVFYNDGSACIISIKNALDLSRIYGVVAEEV